MSNKYRYLDFLIIALLVVVMLQMCNKKTTSETKTYYFKDTTWIKKDSVIHSAPKLIIQEGSVDSVTIREYLPDTNYARLLAQYNGLLQEYLTRNTYSDSLKIDSIGYVHVTDSVTKNSIMGRSYHYALNYPIIHDSVVKYAPPQRELYYGGGFNVAKDKTLDMFNTGLMYKDKLERVYILSATINRQNDFGVQLQTFWKLK
jgi:hypothetical protein